VGALTSAGRRRFIQAARKIVGHGRQAFSVLAMFTTIGERWRASCRKEASFQKCRGCGRDI
jgi:hypothetical protein